MTTRQAVDYGIDNIKLNNLGEPIVDKKDLQPFTFNEIKEDIIQSLLVRMYKFNPELRDKIKVAYKELGCGDFDVYEKSHLSIEGARLPSPPFIHGPAGHGKTAVTKEAVKEVCQYLGLNLVTKFERNYIPSHNDFVLPVVEMSNETSSLLIAGIPVVGSRRISKIGEDGELTIKEEDQVRRALKHSFNVLNTAPYGACVLDDISNLPRKLQNIMLSLMDESRFQSTNFGMDKMFVATGNMGHSDGSVANSIPSSVITRCSNVYLQSDSVEETVPYMMKKHSYENFDGGVSVYLHYIQDILGKEPYESSVKSSSHLCPRTVDNLSANLAIFLDDFDHVTNSSSEDAKMEFKSELKNQIERIIGKEKDNLVENVESGKANVELKRQSVVMTNLIFDYTVSFLNDSKRVYAVKDSRDMQEFSKTMVSKLSGHDNLSQRMVDEMMLTDSVLCKMFDKQFVNKDFAKLTNEERRNIYYQFSTLFKDFTDKSKGYAINRVENTLPVILKREGFEPEKLESIIDYYKKIVSAEIPKPEQDNKKDFTIERG